MDKPFLTYDQMLNKLTNEKGLIVDNRDYAIKLLKENSYFSLICGYKHPFKMADGHYRRNVSIEDIFQLYDFDNDLRHLFFQYILKVENHIKSLISYAFCSEYGAEQSSYLNATNFEYIGNNQDTINKLILKLTNISTSSGGYHYIDHQRNQHNNVPLWVIMKALTLGTVSKMYSCLTNSVQSKVSVEFDGVNEHDLSRMLEYTTRIRNVCAHNERLFDFRYVRGQIIDTDIHHRLSIAKNPNYIYGKNDLFAMVIILKHLLGYSDFESFFFFLKRLIDNLFSNTNVIQRAQLYKYMGFPANWEDILSL